MTALVMLVLAILTVLEERARRREIKRRERDLQRVAKTLCFIYGNVFLFRIERDLWRRPVAASFEGMDDDGVRRYAYLKWDNRHRRFDDAPPPSDFPPEVAV